MRPQQVLHFAPALLGQGRVLQPHLDKKFAHLFGLGQTAEHQMFRNHRQPAHQYILDLPVGQRLEQFRYFHESTPCQSSPCPCQESSQQRWARRGKWINYGHTTPSKTILKILTQKQSTTVLGRHRQYQRIPDWQLMVNRQIERSLKRRPSRIYYFEAVSPSEHRLAGRRRRAFGFSGEHPGEFPKRLSR